MKINVVNASAGTLKCWVARVEGRPEIMGAGESYEEAVGALLVHNLPIQVKLDVDIIDMTPAPAPAEPA